MVSWGPRPSVLGWVNKQTNSWVSRGPKQSSHPGDCLERGATRQHCRVAIGGAVHSQLARSLVTGHWWQWEGKAALAGFCPSIKENRPQAQARAGQDICGLQLPDGLLPCLLS